MSVRASATGRDAALGAVALAVAAAYGYAARDLPQSLLADPVGASGLPVLYAIALAALALVLIVRTLLSRAGEATPGDASHAGHVRALGLLLPGVAYVVLVGTLGYFATILLLIVAVAWYTGARAGATLFAIGLAGAVAMWATFVLLFGIPLPAGSLWPRLGA